MRHILVVDDDPQMSLAIQAWLFGFRDAGWRPNRPRGHRSFDVRSGDRRCLHAADARSRVDQDVSRSGAGGAADRDFRVRLFQSGGVQPRLPADGAEARRDALPAQTLEVDDLVERDRRMPVGGRASSQALRNAGLRCGGGVGAKGRGGNHGCAERGGSRASPQRFRVTIGCLVPSDGRKSRPGKPKVLEGVRFGKRCRSFDGTKRGDSLCITIQEFRN